ncbi:MAG: hypothetical protein AB7H88_03920 [Vicinamibacterales bacterium]
MALVRINHHPSRRDLRQFSGIWLPLFAALAGASSYWGGSPDRAIAIWAVGGVLGVAGLLSLTFARWVFVGLSYLTYPIGFVVAWVVLSVVYGLVVTPIAFVQRRRGRDPLRLRRPPGSLWVPRGPRGREAARHFRQY